MYGLKPVLFTAPGLKAVFLCRGHSGAGRPPAPSEGWATSLRDLANLLPIAFPTLARG